MRPTRVMFQSVVISADLSGPVQTARRRCCSGVFCFRRLTAVFHAS